MILLRPDCLVFKDATTGEGVPGSAHELTLELVGSAAQWVDPAVVENAVQAVLHYFKKEKSQDQVTFGEFSVALEKALRGLGVDVKAAGPKTGAIAQELIEIGVAPPPTLSISAGPDEPEPPLVPSRVVDEDLQLLAGDNGNGCELFFFPRLRDAVRARLDGTPVLLRFRGLRGCVKQLSGARRWTPQCQQMHDRIVDYLRQCLTAELHGDRCLLVVH